MATTTLFRRLDQWWLARRLTWSLPVRHLQAGVRGLPLRAQLRRVLDRHSARRGAIIMLTNMDWHAPFFQRNHQLARAFSRQGYLVLYCTPNKTDRVRQITEVEPGVYITPFFRGLRAVPDAVVYLYHLKNRWMLSAFKRSCRIIYDYLDDVAIYRLPAAFVEPTHRWLIEHATVVCATATNLLLQVRPLRPDAILCPNAVDYQFFHRETKPEPPEDLRSFLDRPIIGYHGALARWVDYALIRHVAHAMPDVHFVFIGAPCDRSMDGQDWSDCANVHFIGRRPYEALPDYLAHFSVAIIPFQVNQITRSTSPVKLFEYFAAGLPVVTTDMPECRKYRGVTIAEDAEAFVIALRQALAGGKDAAVIDADARANDWQHRAEAMLGDR